MRTTKPGQFKAFVTKLMKNAPEGYTPWIFPVQKRSKAPSTRISWKAKQSQQTIPEAMQRLKGDYGNVGIAGKPDDQLILLDVDDPSILDEVKDTLKIRSRSRGTEKEPAIHAIYWADPEDDKLPCNIPTDKGEIRSSDQYVVAPGSYVPCTEEELSEKVEEGEITKQDKQEILNDEFRGYYTVHDYQEIAEITFDELPDIFKETFESSEKEENRDKEEYDPDTTDGDGDKSALFDLTITDLTARGYDDRDPHPLHDSATGANFCISSGVGHCWRHLVSLNALQFLCVESGYMNCLEAGSPHHNSSAGQSEIIGDDEAIWRAWKYAKENGYIPEDDPVPVKALHHIARKYEIYQPQDGEIIPPYYYKDTLDRVEEELQ
jgi:putative DNA primase/helicase